MILVTIEGPKPLVRLTQVPVTGESGLWVIRFESKRDLLAWMSSKNRRKYRVHEVNADPTRQTLAEMRAAEDAATSRQAAIKAAHATISA